MDEGVTGEEATDVEAHDVFVTCRLLAAGGLDKSERVGAAE